MTLRARFAAKVAPDRSGCHLWTGAKDRAGYGNIYVGRGVDGQKKWDKAPRVAWLLHHGTAIPDGLCACHRCDTPACVNPDHLFLGTRADNLADMTAKGRRRNVGAPGEANSHARLTEVQVQAIRRRVLIGEAKRALAREFGVSHGTIQFIASGITWRAIPEAA